MKTLFVVLYLFNVPVVVINADDYRIDGQVITPEMCADSAEDVQEGFRNDLSSFAGGERVVTANDVTAFCEYRENPPVTKAIEEVIGTAKKM